MRKNKHSGIVLLFLLVAFFCQGKTDSSLVLIKSQWEELRADLDYTETYKTPQQEERAKEPVSMGSTQYFSDLKYFIYGVLVLALLIVIVVLVRRNKQKSNPTLIKQTISPEDIDKNVHEIDLEMLLKTALEQANYRLALRLQFLMVIKALSQKGKINWAKEKTNWEYHLELKDKLMADRFRELILNFESFWYGEHELNEQNYLRAEPLYRELLHQLNPHA